MENEKDLYGGEETEKKRSEDSVININDTKF